MAAEGQTGSKMLDEMPEYRIFELLKKYHYTLTTAESATGGMIASTLINVPGISAFFTEGYVTYSNEAKVKMIHVKPETIERYGVVSAETAADMAVSAARTADTDTALSVTGVAGPDGGTRECPVGLVTSAAACTEGLSRNGICLRETGCRCGKVPQMRRFIYLPARSQRREPYANHSWNGEKPAA